MSGRGPDKQPRRAWTADDDAQLVALVGQGLSRREVAALAGRSQGAVRIRCNKLGVHFCPERAKQRAREAMAAIRQCPEYRAKLSAGVKAAMTDERRAYHSERCTRLRLWERGQAVLATDADAAKRRADKARVNMKTYRRDALAWCPDAYRAEYHTLASKLRGRGGAAAARAMIEDTMARDKRRASEAEAAANGWSMKFQAELERVRAGAVLIEIPRMRRALPDLSPMGGTLNF